MYEVKSVRDGFFGVVKNTGEREICVSPEYSCRERAKRRLEAIQRGEILQRERGARVA